MKSAREILSTNLQRLISARGIDQRELALKIGVSDSSVSQWISGEKYPRIDKIQLLADYFNVQRSDLTEEQDDNEATKQPYYALTSKDERDIAIDLERIMADLDSKEALAFHGEPMDDEDRELLRRSLENSLIVARQMAKKKFTPKKFRN